MDLAATMLIKLEDVALSMNTGVIINEGVDSVNTYDKSTWKYYQNISGEYHFSDKMMKIKSLDMNSEIDFTIDNLNRHKLTKRAYVYGSRYYKELVSSYPDQELLILGIINPTNKQKAIDAKEGTILSYPKYLVEDNEYSLIDRLQKWIYNYLFRWVNRQYTISDDLYLHTYVYQLTLHLLQAIISYRLELCKTNEAHSYHVRAYLASHGFLDTYLPSLTKKQSLFFYRNIRYIERNAGKVDTLNWLVDHTFTERDIPLYELKVNQDTSSINTFTNDLKVDEVIKRDPLADIIINRKPLNDPASNVIKNDYTLDDTLTIISDNARDNNTYQEDNKEKIKDVLKTSDSSIIQTKLLQSYINENGNVYYYTLEDIVYNHWIYLAAKDRYKASIFITLPKTNEKIVLTSQQSVALYMYCTAKAYGFNLNNNMESMLIPSIRVNRVERLEKPTEAIIKSKNDINILSELEVKEILDTYVEIKEFYSIPDFTDLCLELYKMSKIQYSIYSDKEQMDKRAYAHNLVNMLYCDETLILNQLINKDGSSMTYEDFLNSINLTVNEYTELDLLELATVILSEATLKVETEIDKLTYIQRSMSHLLLQLSSYSIQIVDENNELPTLLIPNVSVRVGYQYTETLTKEYLLTALVKILKINTSTRFKVFDDLNYTKSSIKDQNSLVHFNETNLIYTDVSLDIINDSNNTIVMYGYQYTGLKGQTDFTSDGNFNNLPLSSKNDLLKLMI